MGTRFRPYQPDQPYLLPPSPRDWLPEGHLVYFISDTVDALALEVFYRRYRGSGRRACPYEPRMLLKVLLYGYCTGVFSSRKLARGIEENVAMRYLAGGNQPSHRTICRFRQEHLKDFQDLFVQVVQIAREVGLVELGTLAVDGTKVKANASKHKAMSYGRMRQEERRLRREIRSLTRRAAEVDAAEDEQYGPDFRGDELPEELRRRQERLAKIREAKARLEARQRAEEEAAGGRRDDEEGRGRGGSQGRRPPGRPPDKRQENFTDPDSRIMGSPKKGFVQGYNAQIGVDGKRRLVVSNGVSNNASDAVALLGQVDQVRANLGRYPQRVLADAGYKSEANLRGLEARQVRGYVALGKGESKPAWKGGGTATSRMARRLRSKQGRAMYKKRKHIVEPVFGWIKQVLGFRSFSVRGMSKVSGEWSLVCLATNLRRMNEMLRWT